MLSPGGNNTRVRNSKRYNAFDFFSKSGARNVSSDYSISQIQDSTHSLISRDGQAFESRFTLFSHDGFVVVISLHVSVQLLLWLSFLLVHYLASGWVPPQSNHSFSSIFSPHQFYCQSPSSSPLLACFICTSFMVPSLLPSSLRAIFMFWFTLASFIPHVYHGVR